MKKRILITAMLLAVTTMLCSCTAKKEQLSLKEKTDTLSMKIDEKYTIKLNYEGKDPIAWTSNDEAVAVVSPDGTVSAVGSGITTVTARTQDSFLHVGVIVAGDGSYIDEFGNHVEIFDGVSDITEISVGVKGGGKDDISVKTGDSFQLRAYTEPSDSKDKIVWRTENASVARVDESGMMKAHSKGMTKITAYAPNGVKGELIVRVK